MARRTATRLLPAVERELANFDRHLIPSRITANASAAIAADDEFQQRTG
jgi:hypothetical protein